MKTILNLFPTEMDKVKKWIKDIIALITEDGREDSWFMKDGKGMALFDRRKRGRGRWEEDNSKPNSNLRSLPEKMSPTIK